MSMTVALIYRFHHSIHKDPMQRKKILKSYLFDFFARSECLWNKRVTFNCFNFFDSFYLLNETGLICGKRYNVNTVHHPFKYCIV